MSAERPVAAVHLEGTVTEGGDPYLFDFGRIKPGAKEKLATLQLTHYVLLVTPSSRSILSVKALQDYLRLQEVPYDEIWVSNGVPLAAVRYDDEALIL